MPLKTILLKTGAVPTTAPGAPIYEPSDSDPKQVAIVQSMRFTNTGSSASKLQAWFQKDGGTFSSSTARRILPFDLVIPAGFTLIEDSELTLDSGDGLYLKIDSGTVEFVLSGIEREAS